jgi:hypothetical protein
MPRRAGKESRAIQPGDTGIWATCSMKKEAKSVSDLRDLFQEVCGSSRSCVLDVSLGKTQCLPRCSMRRSYMSYQTPTAWLAMTATLHLKRSMSRQRSRESSLIFASHRLNHCSLRSRWILSAVRYFNRLLSDLTNFSKSDILQDTCTDRACGIRREDLSGCSSRCSIKKLSLRQASNPNHCA